MLAARGAAAAWAALLLAALAAAPAGGEWVVADGDGRACADMSLCTPSNLTWEVPVTYDAAAGCALLVRKGLRDIHLRGDSFQRHLYVGLVLTLSGNYASGALLPGTEDCDANKQFDEKRCRLQLDFRVRVCGGAVVLRYRYEDPFVDDVCAGLPGNLTLWSIGNHEIGGDFANITHFTKNNVARHVAYLREGSLCPHAAQHAAACRLWWVSTHQRLNHRPHIRFNVEDHSTIRRFNLGMRAFFEAGHCGPGHVVDVFNMTHALVTELGREAVPLTYDSVHWAGVVNLIKAQIVLNDIASELPDANAQPPPLRRI